MKKIEMFQARAQKKCFPCFRKKECLLLPSERDECLGPFSDVQDQLNKFQKYCEEHHSKPKADLDRAVREVLLKNYFRKKQLFDDSEDR